MPPTLIFTCIVLLMNSGVLQSQQLPSSPKPGGAGHALLFRDNVATVDNFKGFPTDELTFEAWISTTDFCHQGTILSYSLEDNTLSPSEQESLIHHFVIANAQNVLACHDETIIALTPDQYELSCLSRYIKAAVAPGDNVTAALSATELAQNPLTANLVERDGAWHHLAVTWAAKDHGRMRVYMDGSLMADAPTNQTRPLRAGGKLMLGRNQECVGGCSTNDKAFYGLMDEVRIWNVARSQSQIAHSMRAPLLMDSDTQQQLLAYWKFNDPDEDGATFRHYTTSKDWSGRGNDLQITHAMDRGDVTIDKGGLHRLTTGKMAFRNTYAVGDVTHMPTRSFTVEFWAKGDAFNATNWAQNPTATLFSYTTAKLPDAPQNAKAPASKDSKSSEDYEFFDSYSDYVEYTYNVEQHLSSPPHVAFVDDSIRIERYVQEVAVGEESVVGVIAVSVNSNMKIDTGMGANQVAFNASWSDDDWHHIAVTWEWESGRTSLYLDGHPKQLLWQINQGMSVYAGSPGLNGRVGAATSRFENGSLSLGMDQNCPGGCMDLQTSANAELAVVRIWDRTLLPSEIASSMFRDDPTTTRGLVSQYSFRTTDIVELDTGRFVKDLAAGENKLALKGSNPMFVYSTAPLSDVNGAPVPQPQPGPAGYALSLTDRQVVMMPDFTQFPSSAITVEFWMFSTDTCRAGVPFSYAHGSYGNGDNSFLIFNYNSWGVSVMEDEGLGGTNHESGVSSTDGSWHHIAVTWESKTGMTILYQDARPVWSAIRAQGKTIPSGGTLVIGREQDCIGGCFDSMPGAAGKVSSPVGQEYGPQDFTGLVENMRIWKVARSLEEIAMGRKADQLAAVPASTKGQGSAAQAESKAYELDLHHPDLVAFWKFDEGGGYEVRDATANRNDLVILSSPKWEVVRWLSVCGNGVVEAGEGCDDGDLDDGNGCSVHCQVEEGWSCRGHPSVCVRKGEGQQQQNHQQRQKGQLPASKQGTPRGNTPRGQHPYRRSHIPASNAHKSNNQNKMSGAQVFGIVLAVLVGMCLLGGLLMYRSQVVYGTIQVLEYITQGRRRQYSGLDVDTEGLDLTPKYTVCPREPGTHSIPFLAPAAVIDPDLARTPTTSPCPVSAQPSPGSPKGGDAPRIL